MLRQLTLRNFVLVQELELDFQSGFTVLTGETGAGKSILIDALQLALGGRGDAGVVREGEDRSEISALFEGAHGSELLQWMEEAGIEAEHNELLIRRTIDQQGKSRAWINGAPATITQLRELGAFLVDIYGQHAWQGLTQPRRVRELLDAYAQIDIDPLLLLWNEWQSAQNKLDAAKARLEQAQTEHERLVWQIGEVDQLAPQPDEWEELNREHERLSHAQMLIDSAEKAKYLLGEQPQNINDLLSEVLSLLEKSATIDASLGEVLQVIQDAQPLISDANHSLNHWLRHTDLDPERLEELDTRIANWLSLARRYRRQPEELYALWEGWKAELAELNQASDTATLEKNVAVAKEKWDALAQKISMQRKHFAPKLSAEITQAMQYLGMKDGRFDVQLTQIAEPTSHGREQIDFLVSGHAGATPQPLSKVASGGELSRLALAIAVTTSQLEHTPTLIFDEIDAGIGGRVAQAVGQLMQKLGQEHQVFSVTHLAQVASYASQHLVVHKQTALESGHKKTTSDVIPVSNMARIQEISRMLGGDTTSETSLKHAQEMLENAQSPS